MAKLSGRPLAVSGDVTIDSPTLHIDSDNDRVGIGTTSPTETLDVVGIGSFAGADASTSQGNVRVGIDSGGDPGGELMYHTDDHIGLRCADSGAVTLAVKPDGKVGVGTTSPAQVLDVIGTGSFALAEASLSQGNVQVGVDSGGDPGGELMYHTDDYVGLRCADSGAVSLAVKPTGKVGIGTTDPSTVLTVEGTVTLKEQANAEGDVDAYGQLWVKSGTPNTLYFTDDAGTDFQLGAGATALSGSTDNTICTVTGANAIQGEANLKFDGSTLTVTGGVVHAITAAKTSAYEATASDYVVAVNTSGGAVTITLPDATAGTTYIVKDTSGSAASNAVTVSRKTSYTIDGQTTVSITSNYGAITVVSNGSNWFIV